MITRVNYSLPNSSIWEKINWTWAHGFVLMQFVIQLLLLIPQIAVLRAPMRIAAFCLGLFLLFRSRPKGNDHPSSFSAIIIIMILLLEFCLNPYNNSVLSTFAQVGMYLAILSPLFWVKSLKITAKGFESLMFMIWGFQTISACFGLLQVYYPGRFQPALSTVIETSKYGVSGLSITLANGIIVPRPMGLTDTPGGAATAGSYAILFGVVIALKYNNLILRIVAMSGATIGLFCIYLSEVRSILVLTIVSMLFFAVILIRTGQMARVTAMLSGLTALFVGSFSWAVAIGGKSTLKRISSLFADSADQVYQKNRGHFLQDTIQQLLPQYPLGAGMGRWGMMNNYFGDPTNWEAQPIWVEIQWTGWLVDGGLPLIFVYLVAIFQACRTAWDISINRQLGDFTLWGGLVFAYNIGAMAITFNYPIFMSQGGMEFWLINAALFVAAANSKVIDDKYFDTV